MNTLRILNVEVPVIPRPDIFTSEMYQVKVGAGETQLVVLHVKVTDSADRSISRFGETFKVTASGTAEIWQSNN